MSPHHMEKNPIATSKPFSAYRVGVMTRITLPTSHWRILTRIGSVSCFTEQKCRELGQVAPPDHPGVSPWSLDPGMLNSFRL